MRLTTRFILSLLAVITMASIVSAQNRTGTEGRAQDANPRVGSGGLNGPAPAANSAAAQQNTYNNNVVTGNVTGGREFRGFVPYIDPRAFQGPVAGSAVDNFVRNSTPAGTPYTPQTNQINQSTSYYGNTYAAPPPPGFVPVPGVGGYAPAPPPPGTTPPPNTTDSRLPTGNYTVPAPQPMGPSQIDPRVYPETSTGARSSPLTGVRSWDVPTNNAANLTNDFIQIDPATLQRLREEGERKGATPIQPQSAAPTTPGTPAVPAPPPGSVFQPIQPTPVPAVGLSAPAINNAIPARPIDNNPPPTQQGTFTRVVVPVAIDSPQYEQMRKLLVDYYVKRFSTEEEKHRAVLELLKAKQEGDKRAEKDKPDYMKPLTPPTTGPTTQPLGAAALGLQDYAKMSREIVERSMEKAADQFPQTPTSQPVIEKPDPVKVQSLATGVRAKGLANFLTKAEELMVQGKYTSALDQYDAADQVSPDNPVVLLGRSHAELGAAYYTKAEAHLRQALQADPTLLMAQYDLKTIIGADRIHFIFNDLKDLARTQPNSARPSLLLAYLCYNTNDAPGAAVYLNMAEQRTQGKDILLQTLREHWKLPTQYSTTKPAQ